MSAARLVFHPHLGDMWRSTCDRCGWTSTGKLPLPCSTEAEALHVLKLHRVFCTDGTR